MSAVEPNPRLLIQMRHQRKSATEMSVGKKSTPVGCALGKRLPGSTLNFERTKKKNSHCLTGLKFYVRVLFL